MKQKISLGQAEVTDVVMPGQTNHYGNFFGGLLVAQMDKTAGIAATRYCQTDNVTASIGKIVFTKPVRLGEVVVTHARVTYVGKTSMLLKVTAHSENPKGERKEVVESAYMVFVAIEKNGKPKSVPEPVLETKEERELFEEGRMIKETMLKD
ncbi:MAG: acyl-CoA thioesterase [Candidatus Micrarchaeota archaeon]